MSINQPYLCILESGSELYTYMNFFLSLFISNFSFIVENIRINVLYLQSGYSDIVYVSQLFSFIKSTNNFGDKYFCFVSKISSFFSSLGDFPFSTSQNN